MKSAIKNYLKTCSYATQRAILIRPRYLGTGRPATKAKKVWDYKSQDYCNFIENYKRYTFLSNNTWREANGFTFFLLNQIDLKKMFLKVSNAVLLEVARQSCIINKCTIILR